MARFANALRVSLRLSAGLLLITLAASAMGAAPTARQLAPGVMITVAPSLDADDTVSTHDVMELRANPALQWNPEYLAMPETLVGMADKTKFRREIYCLEFSFKPLRMVEVDVTSATGAPERKLVWYLVYRLRNTGQTLKPVEGADGVFTVTPGKGGPVRFVPQFVIEAQDRGNDGKLVGKSYLDRVIPAAVAAIAQREKLTGKLFNSVEIAEQPISVSDGRISHDVWGVATWVDIDPRIDFFSILVGGLTNAYRWTDNPTAYHPGDAPGRGRQFTRKMLQLNFWRPGDAVQPNEREFRLGAPIGKADLYGVTDGVAHRWVYR